MCRLPLLWCKSVPHRCAAQVRDFLEQPFRDAALDATFFEAALDEDTARLASGYDAACLFVNDTASAAVMERLAAGGIRFLVCPRPRHAARTHSSACSTREQHTSWRHCWCRRCGAQASTESTLRRPLRQASAWRACPRALLHCITAQGVALEGHLLLPCTYGSDKRQSLQRWREWLRGGVR